MLRDLGGVEWAGRVATGCDKGGGFGRSAGREVGKAGISGSRRRGDWNDGSGQEERRVGGAVVGVGRGGWVVSLATRRLRQARRGLRKTRVEGHGTYRVARLFVLCSGNHEVARGFLLLCGGRHGVGERAGWNGGLGGDGDDGVVVERGEGLQSCEGRWGGTGRGRGRGRAVGRDGLK